MNKCGKSDNGYTPLMAAVAEGHTRCADLLPKAGADVNFATRNAFGNKNFTALMIAALKRQSECLELLLKSGAIVNTRNVSGCTALHLAERMSDDQMR